MAKTKTRRTYNGPKSEEVLVTDLVTLMESSTLPPWRREWQGAQGEHRNLLSGHVYRGSNPILLELGSLMRGHSLPLWLGASEAKGNGWFPRKGSKAVRIVRPQLNQREVTDGNGQTVTAPDGSAQITAWVSFKPVCVFNAADLVGGDDASQAALSQAIAQALEQDAPAAPAARLEHAESVLEGWPVPTVWEGARAFYSPSADRITMPPADTFTSREAMVATWAHEQAHSTGHSSRLDRPMAGGLWREPQAYAREELVAELASVLACYRLRIGFNIENHASYLKGWASLLKEGGAKVLFQVLSEARKAADLIAPEAGAE
jgi:antirestriction protein ArdC